MKEAQKTERQRLRALIHDYCFTEQCDKGCASCPVDKAEACGGPHGASEVPLANLREAEKNHIKRKRGGTMNRKHNPLVALVALLLLAVLLLCAGCSGVAAAEEPETPKRFTVESYEYLDELGVDYINVITDTETGVQYIFVDSCYSRGLTKLQPAPEEAEQ